MYSTYFITTTGMNIIVFIDTMIGILPEKIYIKSNIFLYQISSRFLQSVLLVQVLGTFMLILNRIQAVQTKLNYNKQLNCI